MYFFSWFIVSIVWTFLLKVLMQKIGNTGTGMHVKLKPSENANEVFICADHVELFVEMSSRAKILEIHYMKCVNSRLH